MGLIDWMADKVQSMTGEKERRNLVSEIKSAYNAFQTMVIEKINTLNGIIEKINEKIVALNAVRHGKVEKTVQELNQFLGKFGKIKAVGAYVAERERPPRELPKHKFEQIEDYINDVDWSREDVFRSTFFLSPLGMTVKKKKQNLSLNEQLYDLKMESDGVSEQLNTLILGREQENCIATLYLQCVNVVVETIEEKILPELNVVQSFFEALEVKDHVLAHTKEHEFAAKTDIALLKNSPYERHYFFVKNAFVFYILACRIYNTPILTRLIEGTSRPEDQTQLKKQWDALEQQTKELEGTMLSLTGRK